MGEPTKKFSAGSSNTPASYPDDDMSPILTESPNLPKAKASGQAAPRTRRMSEEADSAIVVQKMSVEEETKETVSTSIPKEPSVVKESAE